MDLEEEDFVRCGDEEPVAVRNSDANVAHVARLYRLKAGLLARPRLQAKTPGLS